MNNRLIFEFKRGSVGGEVEWLVNGKAFDPHESARSKMNPAGLSPLAQQEDGQLQPVELRNGGGGWVHPMHLHMEEHRTVMRNQGRHDVQSGAPRRQVRGRPGGLGPR